MIACKDEDFAEYAVVSNIDDNNLLSEHLQSSNYEQLNLEDAGNHDYDVCSWTYHEIFECGRWHQQKPISTAYYIENYMEVILQQFQVDTLHL